MAASVFDSPLFSRLFDCGDTARLFTDSAEVRALLLVEGALAKAQGKLGVIPEVSAAAIHRASLEIAIDPGALAASVGQNGVSIPGLVAAFREAMSAPEHAQYIHWGATSQDIMDTALMLRLRQALALAEDDLKSVLMALAGQAETYADLPMAGRTYGQVAAPTSWGAVVAGFGAPLLDALAALPALRDTSLNVSLTGAVGTSAALGPTAAETRRALAEALRLNDPGRSWHTDRGPILAITDWQGRVMSALSHMAETLIALTGTDRSEIALGSVGGSSTMPQKQNPVGPSAVRALHHLFGGLRTTLHSASVHRDQRDGAAWFAEWMVVPQLTLSVAAALNQTKDIAAQMKPQPEVMAKALKLGGGAVFAEALSFALTQKMPRTAAQSEAKRIALKAKSDGGSLQSIALQAHPDLPSTLFDPSQNLGQAPHDARAFADRVRSGCA